MTDTQLILWPWYCRICGAGDKASSEANRDAQAYGHLVDGHREYIEGGVSYISTARAGRTLHVWLVRSPHIVMG